MANRWRRTIVFVLFFLTGITLGTLLSNLFAGIPILSWLTYGQSIGVGIPNPVMIDLSVFQFAFGIGFDINIIKMLCILLCLWLYKLFAKGL